MISRMSNTLLHLYSNDEAYAMEADKENDILFIMLGRLNPQGGESVDKWSLNLNSHRLLGCIQSRLSMG